MPTRKSNAQKIRLSTGMMVVTQTLFFAVVLFLTREQSWVIEYDGRFGLPLVTLLAIAAIFGAPRLMNKKIEEIMSITEGPDKWNTYSKGLVFAFMILQAVGFVVSTALLFDHQVAYIILWALILISQLRLFPTSARITRDYRSDWN